MAFILIAGLILLALLWFFFSVIYVRPPVSPLINTVYDYDDVLNTTRANVENAVQASIDQNFIAEEFYQRKDFPKYEDATNDIEDASRLLTEGKDDE